MSISRDNRRKALYSRAFYEEQYIKRFTALMHNSFIIDGLEKYQTEQDNIGVTPKRYILDNLIKFGAIAFDYETNLFLRFVPKNLDIYGLPSEYQLYGFKGINFSRKSKDCCILRINDIKLPIYPYICAQSKKLVNFDMAIEQNLEAIKTMTIAETDTSLNLLSLQNEAEARQIGSTLFVRNKNAMAGTRFTVESTGAQYLVDKLLEDRQKVINETLAHLGIASANTDKRERVQSIEVNTSLAFALDNIYVAVDTFNYDAKYGNLDLIMRANTSLIDIIKDEKEDKKDNEKDNNDV